MRCPIRSEGRSERAGFAMVAVLLVLMALFVLCAPFLMTLRNADKASAELADRSTLRVTLDAADRHARARLSTSHPALDETPTYDDANELTVTNEFPGDFLEADDPRDVQWDLDVVDVAGRVDLDSASPLVLANLMGCVARLTAIVTAESDTLPVHSTEGFLPEGVLWLEGELVGYGALEGSAFAKVTRGLLCKLQTEEPCGPQPARGHELGAFAVDQRALAIAEWRIASGELRSFGGIERLREAGDLAIAGTLGREAYLALERTTSVYAGVGAGGRWQRGARVVADVEGEPAQGCTLAVDDLRWFNPGTTVRISDGKNTELALVRHASQGRIVLAQPLAARFERLRTIVQPLARVPVNVNTASPEVLHALWLNLKLRGKSARITADECDALVDLVLVSRPFTGFEDFLRRVVLPAGGLDELPEDAPIHPDVLVELARAKSVDATGKETLVGIIDPDDAVALYKNALDANDNELEFSTMPLCFTSRDVYELDLRAAVNAPSGLLKSTGARELVEVVVPQEDLLRVWTRQAELELAPGIEREAAGWLTGPRPTARFDPLYGPVASLRWPTRARAHLGPHDTMPALDPLAQAEYVFPSIEEDGWAQLQPVREDDVARKAVYALHFDDETRELEGRYLPDGTEPLDLAKLGWSASGLMDGVAFSLWIEPRELEEGAVLLDVGGAFTDSDRLVLLFEEGDLVLRVLDGHGDYEATTFHERTEVRHPLTGNGPGMPLDTWTHVHVAVDGSRPDQMALWVDGRRAEKTPGLTRLTATLGNEADRIPVESTDGFPDRCVLRIGSELIEAVKDGEKSFRARYETTGDYAGYGGRLAREMFLGIDPGINQGLPKQLTPHPAGSSVQLYGYSLPLYTNASSAQAALDSQIGAFAVSRVTGIVRNGSEKTAEQMEPLYSPDLTDPFGYGMDGKGTDVEALVLTPADPTMSIEDAMAAFDPRGGYAAILAMEWSFLLTPNGELHIDVDGTRVCGMEVIRYGPVQGSRLPIELRGDQVPAQLPNLTPGKLPDYMQGRGSFPFFWNPTTSNAILAPRNEELNYQTMVIPISIAASGLTSGTGFPLPGIGKSQIAQLTRLTSDSHFTEWVRYDEISQDGRFLVRDDPLALKDAMDACHPGLQDPDTVQPTTGGGGGGGGGGRPAPVRSTSSASLVPSATPPARSRAPRNAQSGSSIWYYDIGERENDDFFVTRSVQSRFQFRGVLGTHSHEQPAGTLVLPVFEVFQEDETLGWPGRFDEVMFLFEENQGEPSQPGFPGTVQHAHRPFEYTRYFWKNGGPLAASDDGSDSEKQNPGLDLGVTYVALQAKLAVPYAATPIGQNVVDNRYLARMTLFPSGELPRMVQSAKLGGAVRGPGPVPSALVDEALFFDSTFAAIAGLPGQLVLAQEFGENDKTFTCEKDIVRTTLGERESTVSLVSQLPQNGGLLRIGDEVLCYDSYDPGTYVFTLPHGGRGLLGTKVQPHRAGEGLTPLAASLPAGVLGAGIGPDDGDLPLLDIPAGFPAQGTVWIDGELVHYTRIEESVLTMPRGSSEPGEMDAKGAGLFRGRFGTERAAHDAGTPVILFPSRYWDRWSDLADAPEMTYYRLFCEQPDAFWKRAFWKVTPSNHPGPELVVMQRTDPAKPWDASPADVASAGALTLLSEGKLDTEGNTIGVQSDRVEWRVFVRHAPGSFDPDDGLAHGWKTTPRLELFGVEYMGPGRTLSRVDR